MKNWCIWTCILTHIDMAYTFFKFNLISLLQRMIKIDSLVVYCNAWVAATQCYLWSQLTVIVGVYRWWSSTQTSTPQRQRHTPQTPTPRDGRWGWSGLPNPPGKPANHGKLLGLSDSSQSFCWFAIGPCVIKHKLFWFLIIVILYIW